MGWSRAVYWFSGHNKNQHFTNLNPWEVNVEFAQPTAWRYMKLYVHRDKLFKLNNLTDAYALFIKDANKEQKAAARASLHRVGM